MRTYERNGVHVDQCTDCRGLFLDRGELERLVEAEGSFYREPAAPRREESRDHGREESDDYGSYEYQGKPHKKRRKNFLEELFD
jgi:Zn-finger nucleic acid-binding protein